jgi:hypothetical protein
VSDGAAGPVATTPILPLRGGDTHVLLGAWDAAWDSGDVARIKLSMSGGRAAEVLRLTVGERALIVHRQIAPAGIALPSAVDLLRREQLAVLARAVGVEVPATHFVGVDPTRGVSLIVSDAAPGEAWEQIDKANMERLTDCCQQVAALVTRLHTDGRITHGDLYLGHLFGDGPALVDWGRAQQWPDRVPINRVAHDLGTLRYSATAVWGRRWAGYIVDLCTARCPRLLRTWLRFASWFRARKIGARALGVRLRRTRAAAVAAQVIASAGR